jgi:hypothetical protein
MKNVIVFSLALALMTGNVLFGQDATKKGGKKGDPVKQQVSNFLKALEPAELTDEQKKEIEELFTKTAKEVVAMRKEAEIPGDIFKKRTEASKEARDAGKKGKELEKAINEKLGLTEKQIKCWTETAEMLSKTKLMIGKLLKEEQIAKFEGQLKSSLTGVKEAGKKKKKADE